MQKRPNSLSSVVDFGYDKDNVAVTKSIAVGACPPALSGRKLKWLAGVLVPLSVPHTIEGQTFSNNSTREFHRDAEEQLNVSRSQVAKNKISVTIQLIELDMASEARFQRSMAGIPYFAQGLVHFRRLQRRKDEEATARLSSGEAIASVKIAGYVPVGITNASEDVKKTAAALNLPYFIGTRLPQERQKAALEEEEVSAASSATAFVEEEKAGPTTSAHTAAEPLAPMVVTHSVRSGQQIFAQNRSLVVLGNVSSGAEVMADEDVVVLGALKGRALAGIGGNVHARIVCQSFDAELISIAHCFTTCDDLEQDETGSLQLHKPTAISLQDDRLHFESSTV
ncbi:unnamed protein product [Phytophthora lilii]|uniref:Unnamed protein product n=1 Tax=Phytophthora lilii TaxID=2077276 RepID=A0A9W6WN53_9STRA|nr:unnamed protein product [Phytophthora lilii]